MGLDRLLRARFEVIAAFALSIWISMTTPVAFADPITSSFSSKALDTAHREVTVELPSHSVFSKEVAKGGASSDESNTTDVEFCVSSWAPPGAFLPAKSQATREFAREMIPALSLNVLLRTFADPQWSLKLGGSRLAMARTTDLSSLGGAANSRQTVELLSARVGAEYSPVQFSSRVFASFVSASVLPTFAVTSRSGSDEAASYFGVPAELIAGSRFKLTSFELALGASAIVGSVGSSSVAGLGVQGSVRVSL